LEVNVQNVVNFYILFVLNNVGQHFTLFLSYDFPNYSQLQDHNITAARKMRAIQSGELCQVVFLRIESKSWILLCHSFRLLFRQTDEQTTASLT
jgi:hypothetical protein